jgi:hypothetical protein
MITQLTSGWRGIAVFALLAASIAASAAWELRGWRDGARIGTAETARADAERAATDARLTLANSVAKFERQRADEQIKVLAAMRLQTRKLLELQTRLAESERERLTISSQLKEGLLDAPLGDARDLGPTVLRYLDRVRSEQSVP